MTDRVKGLLNVEKGYIQWLECPLVLADNGLEQPDRIDYSVPLHKGLLASVPQ